MSRPFFCLTPPKPHRCVTPSEVADHAHRAYIAELPQAEYDILFTDACVLANVLYRAINDYCADHDATEFGAIIEAVMLIRARLEEEMIDEDGAANAADAPITDFDA